MLTPEAQERSELGQAIQQTGDRRRVALAVAVSERLGVAARLIDRQLARVGGAVVAGWLTSSDREALGCGVWR
ncbi:MAG: hypothetical protein ACJ745_21480 [Actinomycetes bacterium]